MRHRKEENTVGYKKPNKKQDLSRRSMMKMVGFGALELEASTLLTEKWQSQVSAHSSGKSKGDNGKKDQPAKTKINKYNPKKMSHGFNPIKFLTELDYVKLSKLPNGQTLREYKLVAEDKEIEVAPGVF